MLTLSEKRDSNPRPRPWQGRALPTELFSQFSLLANPLASLSCPVFVVCVAKVGIIFELANLLAKKIPFALNFPLFFRFRLPPQPPQPQFHPISPQTVTRHMPSSFSTTTRPAGATYDRTPPLSPRAALSLRTRIDTATPLRGSIPTSTMCPTSPAAPLSPPARHIRPCQAPQGRVRVYPRAERQRSAWGSAWGSA